MIGDINQGDDCDEYAKYQIDLPDHSGDRCFHDIDIGFCLCQLRLHLEFGLGQSGLYIATGMES